MTDQEFAGGMLAWRRALQSQHPTIAAAVIAEWEYWLQLQRNEPPEIFKPILAIVVQLSCLDDLKAQVGLAQMLAFEEVRSTVVLVLPNAGSVAIARQKAWRDGWDGLVTFVERDGCDSIIDGLPSDMPLLYFPTPAVLGRGLMENQLSQRHFVELASPLGKKIEGEETVIIGNPYFGRRWDFAKKTDRSSEEDWAGLIAGLDMLSSERDLGISPVPRFATRRTSWPKADRPFDGLEASEDRLSIPEVRSGDELIVRTAREPFHPAAIRRQPRGLMLVGRPNSIRLPGSMLGPVPRMIRSEAHKPDGTVIGDKLLVHVRPSQLEPWMLSCYLNRGGGGNAVIRAFADAIDARIAYAEDEPEVLKDIPVVWGVLRDSDRILAQAKAQGLYFFYIDHAYFDRGHRRSYRITRNGYEAGEIRRCPSDRIDDLGIETRPWRKSGKEIIVCPPTEYFMEAHGCADWLETTLASLKSATDRPIIVREKPKEGEIAVPLPQALETAHALVTHSSNVAIEAVCLGTPVFVAPSSAAAPVGRTDLTRIEDPIYPDRDAWLAYLAYSQYSFEEIADGRAWRMLLELEERELA